jgi:hypothetical protein
MYKVNRDVLKCEVNKLYRLVYKIYERRLLLFIELY